MAKTVQQLFEEFLYESEFVKRVRPETLKGYSQTFKTFTKLTPGLTLTTITTSTITNFFKTLQERKRFVGKGQIRKGIKNSTVATYWCKLNVFFKWLFIHKLIAKNPFKSLSYPTPSYDNKRFLEKREIERILTAIHIHHRKNILLFKRNIALFYLLLFCGLRREEVMLLQLRDIDFQRKLITIRGENSKSGRTRQIPLHSSTLMFLEDYLKERKRYKTSFLFVSMLRDDKLTYDGLKHLVSNIRTASGVAFSLHQMRHTFAVNFLKTTNNIYALKEMLGHKDIRMTCSYLRCLPPEYIRTGIESMNIDNFI